MRSISGLFSNPPTDIWELRGDPFLWKDLSRVFRPVPLPESASTLEAMLEAGFLALTARPISTAEEGVFVERYSHGGMSSGQISPAFWRESGFPLILERFASQKFSRQETSSSM